MTTQEAAQLFINKVDDGSMALETAIERADEMISKGKAGQSSAPFSASDLIDIGQAIRLHFIDNPAIVRTPMYLELLIDHHIVWTGTDLETALTLARGKHADPQYALLPLQLLANGTPLCLTCTYPYDELEHTLFCTLNVFGGCAVW